MTPTWIDFKTHNDGDGSLVAIEGGKTIPFDIRRVYYIYGTEPASVRGFHAHRQLTQITVPVSGACDMLFDDGKTKISLRLNRRNRGLVIPPMIWHEMSNFSPDCVLMVLADAAYDEADYIRQYADFLRHIQSKSQ